MYSKIFTIDSNFKNEMWDLLKKLYPIPRTILGEEYEESLKIIQKIIPIEKISFPSGTSVGSWKIPKKWEAREARIETIDGEILIDFKNNPLHLWQYSISVDKIISRNDLEKHLSSKLTIPNAIPLNVAFYSNTWGFSLTQNQKNKLTGENYRVFIDSNFTNSHLMIGQFFLPGLSKKEILIDSVLSCPSLGNNISGPVVASFLARKLMKKKNRFYSYRFVFTPETIGPLTLHHLVNNFAENIIGGYTLVNLADSGSFNYKKSRLNTSETDKAIEHSLMWSGEKYHVREYDVVSGTCGNEKVYNSLGFEVPIGSFNRSTLGSYPEYDTSEDNLDFISKDKLFDSLKILNGTIEILERNRNYKHTFDGEPFLSGYGIFQKISKNTDRLPYDYLMAFTDGRSDLIEIANKAGICISDFDEAVKTMKQAGLIR